MRDETARRRFALIGQPVAHSLSPFIHDSISAALGRDDAYDLQDIAPGDLEAALPALLERYDGFNVTIPHKEAIIPLLDALDPRAEALGAVNTVDAATRRGYNTDADGVRPDLGELHGRRVLVIGSGGVARTLAQMALEEGCRRLALVGRTPERVQRLAASIGGSKLSKPRQLRWYTAEELQAELLRGGEEAGFDLVIQASAGGMWPDAGELPLERGVLDLVLTTGRPRVFDAIYNPTATRFLLRAYSAGCEVVNGLGMLWRQAVRARQIWQPEATSLEALFDAPDAHGALVELGRELWRRFDQKLVLTGFVGSGKGAVAQALPQALGVDIAVHDLDDAFLERTGQRCPEYQRAEGERAFRRMEAEVLEQLLEAPGSAVIATGAGTLIQPGMADWVHARGALVLWLDVSLGLVLERFRPAFERAGPWPASRRARPSSSTTTGAPSTAMRRTSSWRPTPRRSGWRGRLRRPWASGARRTDGRGALQV